MHINRKQSYLQHKNYNMSIIEDLVNLIAPHHCVNCGAEGSLLCSDCMHGLNVVPSRCYRCQRWTDDYQVCMTCKRYTSIHSLWAVTAYEGAAKELIHRLKFARAKAAAKTVALALSQQYRSAEEVTITYIPTAPTRVRERGYDQAALIAQAYARIAKQPTASLLARLGNNRQVGQRRAVRKQQMQGAFWVPQPQRVANKHILLVDDVLTTGATCEAAARALKQAGAKRVSAIVFAVA